MDERFQLYYRKVAGDSVLVYPLRPLPGSFPGTLNRRDGRVV